MLIEMHLIQNFAPSNLNRDDTGSPKDCEFGGYRRARISSQALKRAMRGAFKQYDLVPKDERATRTKRLKEEVGRRLATRGRDREQAEFVAEAALASVDLTIDPKTDKTQYLLYLGEQEISAFTDLCEANWDALAAAATAADGGKAAAKKGGKDGAARAVGEKILALLNGGRAADLALFGRMLADLPERNIDAASQVAHALSTNQVSVEFDYYTAVDDLKPQDTAGADMIGTVEFNSACFYRYANLDLKQLRRNLGGDDELARRTLAAFLRATIVAIPTGKQNSMAAHNPPSLVMTVVRRSGAWSLANAFLRPVRPSSDGDLVENSIRALDSYWGALDQMYGAEANGVTTVCVATLEGDGLSALKPHILPNVQGVIDRTLEAAYGGAGGQR